MFGSPLAHHPPFLCFGGGRFHLNGFFHEVVLASCCVCVCVFVFVCVCGGVGGGGARACVCACGCVCACVCGCVVGEGCDHDTCRGLRVWHCVKRAELLRLRDAGPVPFFESE